MVVLIVIRIRRIIIMMTGLDILLRIFCRMVRRKVVVRRLSVPGRRSPPRGAPIIREGHPVVVRAPWPSGKAVGTSGPEVRRVHILAIVAIGGSIRDVWPAGTLGVQLGFFYKIVHKICKKESLSLKCRWGFFY